jgi:hypothetical protein
MRIVEEYCHAPKTHRRRGSNRAARKYSRARSGLARLNHNEHSLKAAIDNKRVRWPAKLQIPEQILRIKIKVDCLRTSMVRFWS